MDKIYYVIGFEKRGNFVCMQFFCSTVGYMFVISIVVLLLLATAKSEKCKAYTTIIELVVV